MCEIIALPLILCSVLFGLTHCTSSFDQRQTGDLNVQIDLSNIQLIALLKGRKEDYVDYDYAYDYSEMTIKPQNGTTPKPLNVASLQTQNNGTISLPVLAGNATNFDNIQQLAISSTSQNLTLTNQVSNDTEFNFSGTEANNTTTESFNSATQSNISQMLFNINNTTVNINASATNSVTNEIALVSVNDSTGSPESLSDEPITALTDLLNNVSVTQTTHCRRGFVRNSQGKCEYKVHGTTNALRRIVKLAQKIKVGRGSMET